MGHYSSFILRLWVEPPGGTRWGVIQHVATRDKLRFQASEDGRLALAEAIEFIRLHSAEGEVSLPFMLNGSEPPAANDGSKAAEDKPQHKSEAAARERQP